MEHCVIFHVSIQMYNKCPCVLSVFVLIFGLDNNLNLGKSVYDSMYFTMSIVEMTNIEVASNDSANVCLYKESMSGRLRDYQITFKENETSLENVTNKTRDLFMKVVEDNGSVRLLGRLVAEIEFLQIIDDEEETRTYHISSYRTEEVGDPNDFFTRHMLKIAKRLDNFSRNGSNLLVKSVKHIHILITVMPQQNLQINWRNFE